MSHVDTQGAGAGDEAKRRVSTGQEDHSQERPLPRLPEQTLVSPDRWRSQLPSGSTVALSFFLTLLHHMHYFPTFCLAPFLLPLDMPAYIYTSFSRNTIPCKVNQYSNNLLSVACFSVRVYLLLVILFHYI